MRRGAEVHRTDKLRVPGPGMEWSVRFRFRGRDRNLGVKLVTLERDTKLAFAGAGKMIESDMWIDLLSLAPNRTRLTMGVVVRPKTLGARLLLQSVKLAKTKVQIRFNKRLVQLATDIEIRHASARV